MSNFNNGCGWSDELQFQIQGRLKDAVRNETILLDGSGQSVFFTLQATASNSVNDFERNWVLDLRSRADIVTIQVQLTSLDIEVRHIIVLYG